MKAFLKKLATMLVYTGAGLVILLAILLGLFRLLLPRLPEYQEDIKDWASAAIGVEVAFGGMNARWRLSGPELNFYDAELVSRETGNSLVEAGEVTVGVGLIRLLRDRTLIADRLVVRDTALDVAVDADGTVTVQGFTLSELRDLVPRPATAAGDIEVEGHDVTVSYRHTDGEIIGFAVDIVEVSSEDGALSIEASLDLPDMLGNRLDLALDQRAAEGGRDTLWQFYAEGRDLGMAGWTALMPPAVVRAASGSADASVWLELSGGRLTRATANLAVDDVAAVGGPVLLPFDADGRIEYSRTGGGWLLSAQNFRLRTADNLWPESTLQLQVLESADGSVETVVANASYLGAGDLAYVSPWLPDNLGELYARYRPEGEIRNLRLDLSGFDASALRYDVAAELQEAGLAAQEFLPAVQGFSGSVRANRYGGRVEIESSNLRVDVPSYVPETLVFDDALGTVIWRRSDEGITVLSDSVRLRNADLDSRSSLQLRLPADGSSPYVDLESRWSINDVGSAKRLLPAPIMHPALHRWFDEALVSGMLTNGTTRLVGPLDRFPFDGGEGRFEVQGRLEDATLRYARNWPELSVRSADVRLDGLHLHTSRNVIFSEGNAVTDGRVDIRDLRDPVLDIEAFATGTLMSVRDFARSSPIAQVFGGRLDSVRVAGDASFSLDLTIPLKDRQAYEFLTRIRASDGELGIQGFPVPVRALNGVVSISRDRIESEALFGTFLGEAVELDVRSAGEDLPSYSVVVEGEGRVTAEALVTDLGVPLGDRLRGATGYRTVLRFPRGGVEDVVPLQIAVESELDGLGVDLPEPLAKPADVAESMTALIEFPEPGRIAASGSLGERLRWMVDFETDDGAWDFDRGMLAFGGDYPALPETRGLHIRGQVGSVTVAQWLAASGPGGGNGPSIGDRIRSIDLHVDDLYVLGQHFSSHHVVVDRGAGEWYVTAEGPQITGSITLPYDLGGQRPVVLDMTRLVLPGSDESGEAAGTGVVEAIDPRSLPPVRLRAAEFALGNRYLGAVEADFERAPDGLRAQGITATDPSFTINADAGWIVDETVTGGQRSYVTAELVSNDVGRTMARLDYTPGIESGDMRIDIDLSWPGGPRRDFLADLDGSFVVRLSDGQLDEVEPGAGRMFGLMSIAALPRRLSLDFSDVLDRGFGFDEITGTFRVEDGNAYTCDLSLKGPAADIGIVGRAGLASRDYEQTAIVSANVGDTLPVVGAVVAGPQVAAALLLFSQIFKKPLQEMGQVYYHIEGPFDSPDISDADAQQFAESTRIAGCLAEVR